MIHGKKKPVNRPKLDENRISGEHIGSPLHTMIQWFKTINTKKYIRALKIIIGNRLTKKWHNRLLQN